ncbi:hypothetical protein [Pseudoclavibacter helvolus]|uniref:hypothetical protein n=1 Tax=Pseudoclavibacter helvolus TaxID=255205 RepID=UPI000837F121|nr:hypothetical protein [Pseudoclavibacter helvolus]
MVLLSTEQTAEELNDAFGLTSITAAKVLALVRTGALTDLGPGRSVRVDMAQVHAFTASLRLVTPGEWPGDHPLFRVSLIELREDEIRDDNGVVLRTHAGVDYSNTLAVPQTARELAWTGVWEVSDTTAQRAIAERAVLFGTTKGYINPSYVRTIVGTRRTPDGSRIWWETAPAPAEVIQFVGSGLWMPVKPGRESDWA